MLPIAGPRSRSHSPPRPRPSSSTRATAPGTRPRRSRTTRAGATSGTDRRAHGRLPRRQVRADGRPRRRRATSCSTARPTRTCRAPRCSSTTATPDTYADLLMFQIHPEPPLPALAIASLPPLSTTPRDHDRSRREPRAATTEPAWAGPSTATSGDPGRACAGVRIPWTASRSWPYPAETRTRWPSRPTSTRPVPPDDTKPRRRSGTRAAPPSPERLAVGARRDPVRDRVDLPGPARRHRALRQRHLQRRSLVLPRPDPRRDGAARAERGPVAGRRGRGAARAPASQSRLRARPARTRR